MSDPAARLKDAFAHEVDAMLAGLFPAVSPADRLDLARASLGLAFLAEWVDGRKVYVEAP